MSEISTDQVNNSTNGPARRACVLAAAVVVSTLAVFPAVAERQVAFGGQDLLVWDESAGAIGYQVYRGTIGDLPDYGACLQGTVRGTATDVPEDPPPGGAFFYLVARYDDTGEESLGNASDTSARTPASPCVPARRYFPLTTNSDPGDGLQDGREPRRNASKETWSSRRETTGVYLHTGEFFLAAKDLSIAGRGLDWSFSRKYRSQITYDGPLGHGWDFNANARLAPLGTDVLFHDGTGRREIFLREDMTRFTSPQGLYAVLRENDNGSFALRHPHGTIYRFHGFDGSNVEGALESVEDRNGNLEAYLYDHQGLLVKCVDSLGRAIDYGYDDDGRLNIVSFPGYDWIYRYDANGNLTNARSPIVSGTPNGNDFPVGKETTYEYSSGFSARSPLNHNMLLLVAPAEGPGGIPTVTNVYETTTGFDLDRVKTQTIGGTNASGVPAGGTLSYAYQALNAAGDPADLALPRREATVLDRNGDECVYSHNANGNLITRIEKTNRGLRFAEPDYATGYEYNADGEMLRVDLPEGNSVIYTYPVRPAADRYREGNLTEQRLVADTVASSGRGDGHGGDLSDVVWTYAYEPVYNRISVLTDPRGNDPAYVPQNGGLQSAARYSTTWNYDYEEGDPVANGIAAYALEFEIDVTGALADLGDVNGDALTDRIAGNCVREAAPSVRLDPSSGQASIEGDVQQEIETLWSYNDFGQRTAELDAEGNRHDFGYHPENDPDGDGTPSPAPADGRTLDASSGGFLAHRILDSTSAAGRNNGTDPTPAAIRTDFEYDMAGNLVGRIDGRGVKATWIRNQLFQIVEKRRAAAVADAAGPHGDPATGRGEAGLTAEGFVTSYRYDLNDNVVAVEVEDRGLDRGVGAFRETEHAYDMLDNRVRTTREASTALDIVTRYRYDPDEKLVLTIEPEGNARSTIHDERDLVFRSIRGTASPPPLALMGAGDPGSFDVRGGLPSTMELEYDGNGSLTAQMDGRGNPVTIGRDGLDRPARSVDEAGNTTDYFYDPVGQIVRRLDRGPVDGVSMTHADLADVRYLYDALGRVVRRDESLFVAAGVNPARLPVLEEGPQALGDGFINTVYEYDALSRRSFLSEDSGATTRIDYDGASRPRMTTLPDGSFTETAWDESHNPIETIETELSSSAGPPAEEFLTTHFFDALDRRTLSVDNLGHSRRRVYDSMNAVTATSDPRGPTGGSINRRSSGREGQSIAINGHGNVVRHTRDGLGRELTVQRILTASGEGDGTLTPAPDLTNPYNTDGTITLTTTWDDNSLRLFSQDDRGNRTTYGYDNLNRRTTVTADDETGAVYEYDANDNLRRKTDANGSVLDFTFDAANRKTRLDVTRAAGVEGTTLRTYQYDGLDRLTRATDNNQPADVQDDVTSTFFYDSLSRAVEERTLVSDGSGAGNTDYRWLARDLLDELVYPDSRVMDYAYDGADRLDSITDPAPGGGSVAYDHYGLSRIHTTHYGNGVRTTMLSNDGNTDVGFDGIRRIVNLRHLDPSNGLLAGFEYGYDRASNRTSERRIHHPLGPHFKGELFEYDSAGRLASFTEGPLDAGLQLVGQAEDEQSWTLDGATNWPEMVRNGVTYTATPNNLNEYDEPQSGGTRVDDELADDFLDGPAPGPDGLNHAHDRNGNTTDLGRHSLVFDASNRLVRASRNADGQQVGRYVYDALGRRVKRSVTNTVALNETVRYFHAGSQIVEERDGPGATVRQVSLGAGPIGAKLEWQVRSGGLEYVLHDAAGRSVALAPGVGTSVLERVTYDAYGKPTFENPANTKLTDPMGNFAARSQLGNTNLLAGSRYDPELGARAVSQGTDYGGMYVQGDRYLNPDEDRWTFRPSESAPKDRASRIQTSSYVPVRAASGAVNFNIPLTWISQGGINRLVIADLGEQRTNTYSSGAAVRVVVYVVQIAYNVYKAYDWLFGDDDSPSEIEPAEPTDPSLWEHFGEMVLDVGYDALACSNAAQAAYGLCLDSFPGRPDSGVWNTCCEMRYSAELDRCDVPTKDAVSTTEFVDWCEEHYESMLERARDGREDGGGSSGSDSGNGSSGGGGGGGGGGGPSAPEEVEQPRHGLGYDCVKIHHAAQVTRTDDGETMTVYEDEWDCGFGFVD